MAPSWMCCCAEWMAGGMSKYGPREKRVGHSVDREIKRGSFVARQMTDRKRRPNRPRRRSLSLHVINYGLVGTAFSRKLDIASRHRERSQRSVTRAVFMT